MNSGLPIWNPEIDDLLICRQVRRETSDVRSFIFEARQPSQFLFQAGQFLTFTFPLDAGPISRCYTIASPPTRPRTVAITVKRVPQGPVSNWLHDRMVPGMTVQALGPFGDFSLPERTSRPLLFLSAGSGITPMMSMARAQDDLATGADILFVHSAHSPDDIIYRAELDRLPRHRNGLRTIAICSRDGVDEIWGGHRGRITLPMLQSIAPDLRERDIFLCGPNSYRTAVAGMLAQLDCDPAHLHQESFDFSEVAGSLSEPLAPLQSVGWQVQFSRSRRSLSCPPGTSILQAAREAGLRLPSSCTKGLCGTCKSRLLAGTVAMRHEGGIRQREIDAGMILICCSQPTSDVVIDR